MSDSEALHAQLSQLLAHQKQFEIEIEKLAEVIKVQSDYRAYAGQVGVAVLKSRDAIKLARADVPACIATTHEDRSGAS